MSGTATTQKALLSALGYANAPGFLRARHLRGVNRHRHALSDAFTTMGVVGVFSLVREARGWDDFVPLVYVAVAPDVAAAQEIHRLVWSQSFVPYLLIALPTEVRCCNALSYSSSDWGQGVPVVPLARLVAGNEGLAPELAHLSARALRTSIVWNEGDVGDSRVDKILLRSLRHLIDAMVAGDRCPPLPRPLANAMVGRFLYLRCLKERRIVPARGVPLLRGEEGSATLEMMWETFESLEKVFNGSIFPIETRDRRQVCQEHVELLGEVLLRGGAYSSGRLQFGFRDFCFSAIRTETLSAVYQMFLATDVSAESGRSDGAFYTPPFLVDYVLSKIDRIEPIGGEQTILDCAAGSGLFLVGAFRRLVESRMRDLGVQSLPLHELRELLTGSIWGIERNLDACHVAALSLYLTMLDYVGRDEIDSIVARGAPKIFPTLVGRNILARDYFDREALPRRFPRGFDVVAANPPWDSVSSLQGAVEEYAAGPRGRAIDHGRTAGLFFWKAWDDDLAPGGRFGFLLNSKTLLSSGADRFPEHLLNERVAIVDIVSLAHMRRKLFEEAEAGAILLCGVKREALPQDRFSVFAPLSSSQLVAKDGRPWAIVEDSAAIEEFAFGRIGGVRDLVEAVSLRPIDRAMLEILRSQCHGGVAMSFRDAVRHCGCAQTRGASSADTGIPDAYILNGRNYQELLGLVDGMLPLGAGYRYSLPPHLLAKADAKFHPRFAGNILLIPRSSAPVVFVEQSVAFNSTFNVVHAVPGVDVEVAVLRALALYLNSDFVRYCYSLIGRDWRIDERRFEANEMRDIPVPVELLTRRYAQRILGMSKADVERAILDAFGLPDSMRAAVLEYAAFRAGYHNGLVPDGAFDYPADAQVRAYERAIEEAVAGGVVDVPLAVSVVPPEGGSVAALLVEYGGRMSRHGQAAVSAARAELGSGWRDLFHDSGVPLYDGVGDVLVMLKPWSRLHWTVERAYVDARRLVTEAMLMESRGKRGRH